LITVVLIDVIGHRHLAKLLLVPSI